MSINIEFMEEVVVECGGHQARYIRADIHEAQIKAENAELREILQDAIISHGTFIAYNPLEDAWQFRRIESRARELLEKVCS